MRNLGPGQPLADVFSARHVHTGLSVVSIFSANLAAGTKLTPHCFGHIMYNYGIKLKPVVFECIARRQQERRASIMEYRDFDIQIEPAGDKYRVRVLNSPGGQASGEFVLPFSELELENFLLRMGRSRRRTRRLESPETQAAKTVGGQLFNALFAGEIRSALLSSLSEVRRQDAGLRIRLRFSDAAELADLPWEYLYNASVNRFFSLSKETPIIRFLELSEPIRPLAVEPPLRILTMISSPSDYPALDVEREWSQLHQALEDLEGAGATIERLDQASLGALQQRLRDATYHIFHFVGHGGFDEAAQDGVLLLEDSTGRGRPVGGQDLGTLLYDHKSLRMAVLNTCEGAHASRTDPFAGTAQSLVQQGIPAVIAMQFESLR